MNIFLINLTFVPVLMDDTDNSPMTMIEKILNMINNSLLLPIIVLLAGGVGVVLLIKAVLNTSKHMTSGGKAQVNMLELVGTYIMAGILLATGAWGGFSFIQNMVDMTANTAIDIVGQEHSGGNFMGGLEGEGGVWDGSYLTSYQTDDDEPDE